MFRKFDMFCSIVEKKIKNKSIRSKSSNRINVNDAIIYVNFLNQIRHSIDEICLCIQQKKLNKFPFQK